MRWSERQRAMLREMGVHLWPRPGGSGDPGGEAAAGDSEALAAIVVEERAPLAPAPAASNERADWLVVGDAFGTARAANGDEEPGGEEQLLDNMLRAIGLARSAKTPSLRAAFAPLTGAAGTPADARELNSRLEAAQPRCIVALGRNAAQALIGLTEPIGALRGRVHRRASVPVIVTFALPYLLRNPADKAKAWADLCLAVRTLEGAAH